MSKLKIVALATILLMSGCRKDVPIEKKPQVVKVQPVTQLSLSATRQKYAATLNPYTQTNLAFENQAYVQQILLVPKNGGTVLVDAGDVVPAGTVLARQDPSEFEARAAQARAQVSSAQAQVAEAQAKLSQALSQQQQALASLESAQQNYAIAQDKAAQARAQRRQAVAGLGKASAQHGEARKSFERANVLYHQDAMTKPDWDRTTAEFESAVANVASARAQVQEATSNISAADSQVVSAQAQVKSAQAQVQSAQAQVVAAQQNVDAAQAQLAGAMANLTRAEITLSHTNLKVPTDSVVVSRGIAPGTLAGPSTQAFTVADMRRMKAVFGVPDTDVDQLKVGMDFNVVLEAFPTTKFLGRITSISPSADSKGRVFDVSVMLANPDRKLKNGMIAKIELQSRGKTRSALVVPLSALTRSPRNMDAYAVAVVTTENGKSVVHFNDVKIGRAIDNFVEIEQGVNLGDKIVVGGSNMVIDGDPVDVE